MKIFADKDFLPVLKRFALMGTVSLFAACGDDTSSVKPDDDDPGSDISSSFEEQSSSSKDKVLSSSSSRKDNSSSSANLSSSERSSSSSKGDAPSSSSTGEPSSSSTESSPSSSSNGKVDSSNSPEGSSSSIDTSSSSPKGSSSSIGTSSSSAEESSSSAEESSSSVEVASSSSYEELTSNYLRKYFESPYIKYETMKDSRDQQTYRIMTFGSGDEAVVWMAQNLNYTPTSYDGDLYSNTKSEMKCPLGDGSLCSMAGRLYTWTAAMNLDKSYKNANAHADAAVDPVYHQGVCPVGWHMPTKKEFQFLYDLIDDLGKEGTALKSYKGWNSNGAGNDRIGLSFIPYGSSEGVFYGGVWTADENETLSGSPDMVYYTSAENVQYVETESMGYVRCVKNNERNYGTFKDARDGHVYKYTRIGSQTWMAENLEYKMSGSRCLEENNPSECSKNRRAYDLESALIACPSGWHLPDSTEWATLFSAVGGKDVAGLHLKSRKGWAKYFDEDVGDSLSGNGRDSFGFAIIPVGHGMLAFFDPNEASFNHWYSGDLAEFWSSSLNEEGTLAFAPCFMERIMGVCYPSYNVYETIRCVHD